MALIKCPECGKEISDKSEQCINCGFPLKKDTICIINGKEIDLSFIFDENIEFVNKENMFGKLTHCYYTEEKVVKEILESGIVPKTLTLLTVEEVRQQQKLEASKIHCPKCNSTAITTGARGVNNFWGMLGASKTVNRCGNCGFTWKP